MEEKNIEQEKFINALHAGIEMLMQKKEGRIFLRHILDETGVFKKPAMYETNTILLFEGRRTVGAELLNLIQEQDKNNLAKIFMEE